MPDRSDELTNILIKLKPTLEAIADAKAKDWWDKLSVIASLISGVLIAGIGVAFTILYNVNTAHQTEAFQEQQSRLQQHQNRLQELEIVSTFIPYLHGNDEDQKKTAILAIRTLGSVELATSMATLVSTEGASAAVTQIATSKNLTDKERNAADTALQSLFGRFGSAIVSVKSATSQSSGFFLTTEGHVLTADFVLGPNDTEATLTTSDKQTLRAIVVERYPELEIAVLKTDHRPNVAIRLSQTRPKVGENVILLATAMGEHDLVSLGAITQIAPAEVRYSRQEDQEYQGSAGGPVLDGEGRVAVVHLAKHSDSEGKGVPGSRVRSALRKSGILP